MTTPAVKTKIIPLTIDESLFETIQIHARQEGESMEEFILNRLHDSVDAWTDYCDAVSLLNDEEEAHFHLRVTG